MTDASPALLWFRQDLRLADNPALAAAADRPLLPVYVLDDAAAGRWAPGGAARWWLHHSLAALNEALAVRGAPLLLVRGRAEIVIPALADAIGADEVLAGRLYEPWARERDARVAEALQAGGRNFRLVTSTLLREPPTVMSGSGKPYTVYGPFAKSMATRGEPEPPLPAPNRLHPVPDAPAGDRLADWHLRPQPPIPDWAAEFGTVWTPGEAGAQARLARFLAGPVRDYAVNRNLPGVEGSSGLSPHLRWGEVSPRQVWHAVREAIPGDAEAAQPFLSEILWREFSYHLLWHRPEMPEVALRERFAPFPFEPDAALLRAWQRGRTGIPVVDAGMRQLWRHGWMHNRVRMIAASLLVKQLLQPWQAGSAWFWDTLVDADLASNSASWQWIAGSGTDASPYFRVFNPVLQGEKFDPEGSYVRRFVPELAKLPDRWLHQPWEAPGGVLREAGLVLGRDYPAPVVLPEDGRRRALDAFARLRAGQEPAA